MSKYLVLKFNNWIDKEQARQMLKMSGYEAFDDSIEVASAKIPKEEYIHFRKNIDYLKDIKGKIAREIGMYLLESGQIVFEQKSNKHYIEIQGFAHTINVKDIESKEIVGDV